MDDQTRKRLLKEMNRRPEVRAALKNEINRRKRMKNLHTERASRSLDMDIEKWVKQGPKEKNAPEVVRNELERASL